MRTVAVLSMHTSPLAQPGTGDGGGMNVYVRELAAALARSGVACDVYTRSPGAHLPAIVNVEPGFRVHHVPAGPLAAVDKRELPELVGEFTEGVLTRMRAGHPADVLHANYWLSGVAGHALKHELDVPLVSTFHTLARVKAAADVDDDGFRRSRAEGEVMACSDAILASSPAEAFQLVSLYGADRARIVTVPPGVDHAFFGPGARHQARRAIGMPEAGVMLLFVGRIQPLKGVDVAVRAFAELIADREGDREGLTGDVGGRFAAGGPGRARGGAGERGGAFGVVVGGPSGRDGEAEVKRIRALVNELGVAGRVHLVPPQPHELLSSYYRAADVVLVPSRTESFGLVALEAGACGVPVVAAAVGGLRSLVDHGRTGFLVEGRDPDAFAAAARTVLADSGRAIRMGEAAAARAGRYSWSVAAAGLRRLYGDLTARQPVDCG